MMTALHPEQAEVLVDAGPHQVRTVLLDALALPDWNPAFTGIEGPSTVSIGQDYQLSVRPGLRGSLTYQAIEPTLIRIAWQVPGFHEVGDWVLHQTGNRTVVRHEFRHTGPLAKVLSGAYRGVAQLRLDRLAERLAAR